MEGRERRRRVWIRMEKAQVRRGSGRACGRDEKEGDGRGNQGGGKYRWRADSRGRAATRRGSSAASAPARSAFSPFLPRFLPHPFSPFSPSPSLCARATAAAGRGKEGGRKGPGL
eukprot:scaffold72949_cov35-Tisochrysis_lutea.AAC.5